MITTLPSKQPWEKLTILFDFTNDLGDEDVDSVDSVTIVDADDTDVTTAMHASDIDSISGKYAYVGVQAGTDGGLYKITVRVVTSTTRQYELDARLPVREL